MIQVTDPKIQPQPQELPDTFMETDNFDPAARIFFSDHVLREAGSNKLSIIGIFQAWNAPQFPFTVPRFIATVSLENLINLPSKLNLTVRIEQIGTGHVLTSSGAAVGFAENIKVDDATSSIEVSFPVGPFIVNAAGKYVAVVLANGNEIARKQFFVNSITQPQSG